VALLLLAAGSAIEEPRPLLLTTAFEAAVTLEPDPPRVPVPPPESEVPPPVEEESLLELLEVPADRGDSGVPAAHGAPAPGPSFPDRGEFSRRGPAQAGPGVGGAATGSGGDGGIGDSPAAGPREAVFAPARRRGDACPPPEYPAAERRRGVEGSLRLRLVVGRDGKVRSVAVAEPSGTESLDAAAVAAVRDWLFVPATEDGEAVESTVVLPVSFRLRPAR
jgi:protein TonB